MGRIAQWLERFSYKEDVDGPNPSTPTKCLLGFFNILFMIVFTAIVPHPPLVVPEIGKGQEKKLKNTHEAMQKLSKELAETEPDVIIFITPHSLVYPDRFNICAMDQLVGSFSQFGVENYSWRGKNDLRLACELAEASERNDVPTILYKNEDTGFELDQGVTIPLYFFDQQLENAYKVIPIGYSHLSRVQHYQFGQTITEICEKSNKRVAVIATGDLSHRLDCPAPEGFEYEGKAFDGEIKELLELGDEASIMQMDEDMVENAGECGYNSIVVLLGVLSGKEFQTDIYSYEAPFGVGHMVANLKTK